jgi:hypothetical protein
MANYIFRVQLEATPSGRAALASNLKKIIEAYKHGGSAPTVWGNFVGDGSEVYVDFPLNSLAELDQWAHLASAVTKVHGEAAGKQILAGFTGAIAGTKTTVLSAYEL